MYLAIINFDFFDSTYTHSRYKHFYFQNTSTFEEVTEIMVTEVSSRMGGAVAFSSGHIGPRNAMVILPIVYYEIDSV